MARLLDDLLDISRISRNKFVLEKQPHDLRTSILHSIEMVQPVIAHKNHTLETNLPEHEMWVSGDPVRLEQMIVNVLNNAAKYTEPNGHISLTCTNSEKNVSILVKDTGIGIEPHMLDKIFEPFLQVSAKNVNTQAGLGIGLSLSKKLAELHDGTIVAQSEGSNKGSLFRITLPLLENSEWLDTPHASVQLETNPTSADEETTSEDTDVQSRKKYSILVVDDNAAAADGLVALLTHKGHVACAAYSGTDALEILKQKSPDIVILDIGMPDMNGYEVARVIREQISEQMILIALTGFGQDEDVQTAHSAGFNYHLTKPVGIDDIEKILLAL